MMDDFGRAHAGKEVTTAEFRSWAQSNATKLLNGFFDSWLNQTGLPKLSDSNGKSGGIYSILSFMHELDQTLIVYGTTDEAAANREAAKALQRAVMENWSNVTVPIKADKSVTDDDLKNRHLLLIGRPDSNTLVERFRSTWPITFGSRSFVVRNDTYAHPGSAVIAAGDNPLNKRYSAVVLAGLSAKSTVATLCYVLRAALEGWEPYIWIVSDTSDQAARHQSLRLCPEVVTHAGDDAALSPRQRAQTHSRDLRCRLLPALGAILAFLVPSKVVRPWLVPLFAAGHLALVIWALGQPPLVALDGWIVLDDLVRDLAHAAGHAALVGRAGADTRRPLGGRDDLDDLALPLAVTFERVEIGENFLRRLRDLDAFDDRRHLRCLLPQGDKRRS